MKKKTLSLQQSETLIGLILGDAHLGTQNKGKSARLIYSQGGEGEIGAAHKKYLFSVYDLFKDWCTSPPKTIFRENAFKVVSQNDTRNIGKMYQSYRFQTVSDTAFLPLFEKFYKPYPKTFKNSKLLVSQADSSTTDSDFYLRKIIPSDIGDILSACGLTYWYMDDGSIKDKKSGACLLNTQSFTLDECLLLCDVLYKNFGLDANIRYKNRIQNLFGHQIYISTKGTKLLDCLTDDYLEEMRYKLPKKTNVVDITKVS